MLSWLADFYRRHRRKVYIFGALIGGLAFYIRHNRWRLRREMEAKHMLKHLWKQQHWENLNLTANNTAVALVTEFSTLVEERLNPQPITDLLKNAPANKIELWKELAELVFTRSLVLAIGNSLLVLLVRVQMAILGGYLYKEAISGSEIVNRNSSSANVSHAALSSDVQKNYLLLSHYFLEEGLQKLSSSIRSVVKPSIATISLKQNITFKDLEALFMELLGSVKACPHAANPILNPCAFLLPDENAEELCGSKYLPLTLLTNDTRDVLESFELTKILPNCMKCCLSHLLDRTADILEAERQCSVGLDKAEDLVSEYICYSDVAVPFARIVPVLSRMLTGINSRIGTEPWPRILEANDQVAEFTFNVYEAFGRCTS